MPAAMCADKALGMFVVTEADAAAIRATFDQEGELSAAIDMADYWKPTAEGYFSRVSKAQTLAAIGEASGADAKAGFVNLKKAALVDAAKKKSKARAGYLNSCG